MILVLASESPRRRQLLDELGIRFKVEPADIDELAEEADPRQLVLHNCELKAAEVAARHPDSPVLGADTTVSIDGCVLNKPAGLAQARVMLKRLSGRTHVVYTGICLIFRDRGIRESLCVSSEVTFQELDEGRIERYFKIVDPLDKAGAYGIQEGRELIIESYRGSLSNIMGLPVEETINMLETFGLFESLIVAHK